MATWKDKLADKWKPLLMLSEDYQKEAYEEGNALCLDLLRRALEALEIPGKEEDCRDLACRSVEISWERLHSGASWRDVTWATRMSYAKAQLILAACDAQDDDKLHECLRRLDMVLLMAPCGMHRAINDMVDQVQHVMDEKQQQQQQHPPTAAPTATEPSTYVEVHKRKRPRTDDKAPSVPDTIPRIAAPSLLSFTDQYVRPRRPVILTGCMDEWPAMGRADDAEADRAWCNLDYIKRVAGRRTVPVEVGRGTYLTSDWGQKLMSVRDFIDRFIISQQGEEKGYLAQHELFEQIPQLRRDIITPDYCALDDEDDACDGEGGGDGGGGGGDDGGHIAVNAWFGPGGTVSPTHTDPYHNLLAQVVGSKEVQLFAPSESAKMYPCEGLMSNNSQVNPKDPDLDRFPLFRTAQSTRCVLQTGEMLYIPPFFWHHIESLETSFSVSFWWGKKKEQPPLLPPAITTNAEDRGEGAPLTSQRGVTAVDQELTA